MCFFLVMVSLMVRGLLRCRERRGAYVLQRLMLLELLEELRRCPRRTWGQRVRVWRGLRRV